MQALVSLLENRPFKGLFFFVRLNLLPSSSFVHQPRPQKRDLFDGSLFALRLFLALAHTSPCLLASTAASARLETLSFL